MARHAEGPLAQRPGWVTFGEQTWVVSRERRSGTPGSITVRRGRGSIGQQDSPFGSTGMSANGSRDTANRNFLDGVEFMDYDAMTYAFSPSVDALAEFKVETSTYSAEAGGAPGGQVSIITKRGGNECRGTLWAFNRNDALTQTYMVKTLPMFGLILQYLAGAQAPNCESRVNGI